MTGRPNLPGLAWFVRLSIEDYFGCPVQDLTPAERDAWARSRSILDDGRFSQERADALLRALGSDEIGAS